MNSKISRTINSFHSIFKSPNISIPQIKVEDTSGTLLSINSLISIFCTFHIVVVPILYLIHLNNSCFQNILKSLFLNVNIFASIYFGLIISIFILGALSIFISIFLAPHFFYFTDIKKTTLQIDFTNSFLYVLYYSTLISITYEVICIIILSLYCCIGQFNNNCNNDFSEFFSLLCLLPFIFSYIFMVVISKYSSKKNLIYIAGNLILSVFFIFFYPLYYIKLVKNLLIIIYDFLSYTIFFLYALPFIVLFIIQLIYWSKYNHFLQ